MCPWSLALASSIPVLGLESVCPRKGCPWPWPWPLIFFVSLALALASSLVSSTPPLVNDIFSIFDFTSVLYADDTCLYVKASKEKVLETLMIREVEIANLWMKANKLIINAAKSSALVRTPGAKTAAQKPKILCDGLPIAINSDVKYLRLWIDENHNFDIHLNFVEHKIGNVVGLFSKLKCYFPKESQLQIYHALIYLNLLYAILIWGCTYKSYTHKISVL